MISKIFKVMFDIVRGYYLGQVIVMWPVVVLFVWTSERTMGYNTYTIKDANSYTWKTWNEIRKNENQ